MASLLTRETMESAGIPAELVDLFDLVTKPDRRESWSRTRSPVSRVARETSRLFIEANKLRNTLTAERNRIAHEILVSQDRKSYAVAKRRWYKVEEGLLEQRAQALNKYYAGLRAIFAEPGTKDDIMKLVQDRQHEKLPGDHAGDHQIRRKPVTRRDFIALRQEDKW